MQKTNILKPTCYLAGKMRGIANFNFPLFTEVTGVLRERGWTVISPAENDVNAGEPWTMAGDYNYGDTTYPITPQVCSRLVQRDIDILVNKLDPAKKDAIILMQGWRTSTGAVAEAAVARWLSLRVLEFSFPAPNDPASRAFHLSPVDKIGDSPDLFTMMVQAEITRARAKHGKNMASLHEGLAVIREEYLEFEREVFMQKADANKVCEELVQMAAMCRRLYEDILQQFVAVK